MYSLTVKIIIQPEYNLNSGTLRNKKNKRNKIIKYYYSLASPIPSALIANIASDSGKQGES